MPSTEPWTMKWTKNATHKILIASRSGVSIVVHRLQDAPDYGLTYVPGSRGKYTLHHAMPERSQ